MSVNSDSLGTNPFTSLISNINGTSIAKPRKPIPYNLWAKTSSVDIEAKLKQQVAKLVIVEDSDGKKKVLCSDGKKKPLRGEVLRLRGIVTRDLFAELASDFQLEWKAKADLDHSKALAAWSALAGNEPSTDPATRQK